MDNELQALFRYLDKRVPTDGFTERLEKRVRALTRDAEWRRQYMTLYERDQRNIAKGHEEGRLEGLEEGKMESRIELVRNMLKKELPVNTICDVLEISEDDFHRFCSDHGIEL